MRVKPAAMDHGRLNSKVSLHKSFRDLITSPHLALGVLLQSSGGKGFGVVRLGRHAPARADASPFLDEQDAAEKIRLHVGFL